MCCFSLPFPGNNFNDGGEKDMDKVVAENVEQRTMNKLLLVGCDQSGTSTILKQVYEIRIYLMVESCR